MSYSQLPLGTTEMCTQNDIPNFIEIIPVTGNEHFHWSNENSPNSIPGSFYLDYSSIGQLIFHLEKPNLSEHPWKFEFYNKNEPFFYVIYNETYGEMIIMGHEEYSIDWKYCIIDMKSGITMGINNPPSSNNWSYNDNYNLIIIAEWRRGGYFYFDNLFNNGSNMITPMPPIIDGEKIFYSESSITKQYTVPSTYSDYEWDVDWDTIENKV